MTRACFLRAGRGDSSCMQCLSGDPSLRLKNGYAQDDKEDSSAYFPNTSAFPNSTSLSSGIFFTNEYAFRNFWPDSKLLVGERTRHTLARIVQRSGQRWAFGHIFRKRCAVLQSASRPGESIRLQFEALPGLARGCLAGMCRSGECGLRDGYVVLSRCACCCRSASLFERAIEDVLRSGYAGDFELFGGTRRCALHPELWPGAVRSGIELYGRKGAE